jgi:hypothetical protein
MITNKNYLSKIDLGKFVKSNPYKNDIIYDPRGQWDHPGENTRIPGSDITMEDVNYPVWAQPSVGPGVMMQPGQDYNFPGADYVDEFPHMKKGGKTKSKKYSRSLSATNRLFTTNFLFKKHKHKIFDPNASYYEDGGYVEVDDLTPEQIQQYAQGGYIIEEGNNYKQGGAYYDDSRDAWIGADGTVGPNGPAYANGGEYMELDLTPEEIQEYAKGGYVIEDISVPALSYMQEGGEPCPEGQMWDEATQSCVSANETTTEEVGFDPIDMWAQDYEEKNPRGNYVYDKKQQYLKRHKGLNKAAGVTLDNFPKEEEDRINEKYNYNMNGYITDRMAKVKKFNPKKHDEWVDELGPRSKEVVANSKYGSKLQPSLWSRSLAGLATLASSFSPDLQAEVKASSLPGLTRKETNEIYNANYKGIPLGGLETFSAGDVFGAATANYLKNSKKDIPNIFSGELMSNVDATDATAMNLMGVVGGIEGLAALGTKGVSLLGLTADALKPGAKALSKFLGTDSGVLSNTYKLNPKALKKAQEAMLVRARPIGQDPYINMAESLRAKEAAGEPLKWYQKNLLNPQTNPDIVAREKYHGQWFADNPSNLDFYINPATRNFADDAQIEILKARMPKSEAAKYNIKNFEDAKTLSNLHDSEYILPKNMVQQTERYSVDDLPRLIEEYNQINKPHWLKGYPEVPLELPGSPNGISSLDNINNGLTETASKVTNYGENIYTPQSVIDNPTAKDLAEYLKLTKRTNQGEAIDNSLKGRVTNFIKSSTAPIDEGIIMPLRYNSSIKKAIKSFNDQKEYFKIPEVEAKLIEYGVDPKELQKIKFKVGNTGSYSAGKSVQFDPREMKRLQKLGLQMDENTVISHELGHELGYNGRRKFSPNNTARDLPINKELYKKVKNQDYDFASPGHFLEYYTQNINNNIPESFAHLREMKQNMINNGIVNRLDEPVSEKQLIEFFSHDYNKGIDRVSSFVDKDNPDLIKFLSKELSNVRVLAPVAGAGALGAGALQQQKNGGEIIVNDLSDHELQEYLKGGYIIEMLN